MFATHPLCASVSFFQAFVVLRVGCFDLLLELFGLLLQLRCLFGLQAGGGGGFTQAAGAEQQGGGEQRQGQCQRL